MERLRVVFAQFISQRRDFQLGIGWFFRMFIKMLRVFYEILIVWMLSNSCFAR
jgi:hypothetical protein